MKQDTKSTDTKSTQISITPEDIKAINKKTFRAMLGNSSFPIATTLAVIYWLSVIIPPVFAAPISVHMILSYFLIGILLRCVYSMWIQGYTMAKSEATWDVAGSKLNKGIHTLFQGEIDLKLQQLKKYIDGLEDGEEKTHLQSVYDRQVEEYERVKNMVDDKVEK